MPEVHGRLSILPPSFYGGVVFISGWRGVGKTLLSAQMDVPDNIAFIDFEDKGAGWHEQLNFGLYRAPVMETGGDDPGAVWQVTRDAIKNLEQDRFTVVILDNISILEAAITVDVQANASEYAKRHGYTTQEIRKDSFGKARACVNFAISGLVARLHNRGVKTVVAISHLGEYYYAGQAVANKRKVKGRTKWQELSILTLILGRGDFPPVPSAIVQKEQLGLINSPSQVLLSDPAMVEQIMSGQAGHIIQRRLPERLPQCTMQEIRKYLAFPADLLAPEEGESAIAEEVAVFSTQLSQEQIGLVLSANEAAHDALLADQAVAVLSTKQSKPGGLAALAKAKPKADTGDLEERIKNLRVDLVPDDEIVNKLKGNGFSMPLIRRAMRELRKEEFGPWKQSSG